MKYLLWILPLILVGEVAFAQNSYYLLNDKVSKHFVGVSYGFGNTGWRTATENYDLYDQHGVLLVDGTATLRAKNSQQSLSLEALVPLSGGKWRAGIGLMFEEYTLEKFEVESGVHSGIHPFVERFRFDKVFAQAEVPLPIFENPFISFNANVRAGWYGFTSVESNTLFGPERIGKSWFAGLGLVTDMELHPRVYAVVMPNVEYKYYRNTRDDLLGNISHKMFAYNLLVGVRVHIL